MESIRYGTWLWGDGQEMQWGDDQPITYRIEISDNAFLKWLRTPSSRFTLLFEQAFGYQSSGVPAEGTLRFSDRPYTDDDGPYQYAAAIEGAPTFERSIDVAKLGGRGTASLGAVTLANADGGMDYLLRYILDGRDGAFYVGDPTWERSQFRQIGLGSVAAVSAEDDTKLTLTLRDKGLLLDATMIGDEMATGPNAGKPKPIILGQVNNFDLTPYLFDEDGPSYYFNNFAQDASLAFGNVIVRDAGVSLINATVTGDSAAITVDAGADKMQKTAHGLLDSDVIRLNQDAFGLSALTQYWVVNKSANDWQVAATRGGSPLNLTASGFTGTLAISSRRYYVDAAAASITLSSEPDGRVTADILAQGTSGDAAIQDVPHAGFRYIMDTWTRLGSANRDTAAFSALVAAQQAAGTRWGMAILDRTNVMDVLDAIAVATNSWYGWDRTGLLTVGKLDLANLDAATATETITEDDLAAAPSFENQAIQFGRLIVDANANVVTQTDGLDGAVSPEDRSKWAQPHQTRVKSTDPTGEQYLADWWTYHRTAIDSKPLPVALVGTEENIQEFCDERQELFAPFTLVGRCTVGMDKYLVDPGDCVEVTYPRYSLDAGKNFRVASVKIRPSEKAVELVLVRQNVLNWDALGVGLTAPGAPTIGTATAGNLKATVTFSAPSSNGGAAITGYRVTSTPSSITADGSASPIVVTGLSNGTPYTFKVKALNSVGYGSESAASNSATPATTVPDAPTAVAAAVASSTSATVDGVAPADNGGSAILDYTATSSPGGLTSSAGALPRTVTGLTTGVDYTFTLHARNANGDSAESAASNSVRPGGRAVSLTPSPGTTFAYNMFAQAGYPTDAVDVTLTLAAGTNLRGNAGYPALTTGTGWAAGSTLTVVCAGGYIDGQVGSPGNGGKSSNGWTADGGGNGYIAVEMLWPLTINVTTGRVFGGGGGGGGGGAVTAPSNYLAGGDGDQAGETGSFGSYAGDGGVSGSAGVAGTSGSTGSIGSLPYGTVHAAAAGGAVGYAVKKNGYTLTWVGYDASRVVGTVA